MKLENRFKESCKLATEFGKDLLFNITLYDIMDIEGTNLRLQNSNVLRENMKYRIGETVMRAKQETGRFVGGMTDLIRFYFSDIYNKKN